MKSHAKWDVLKLVDLTGEVPREGHVDLFGVDARPRPVGKQRADKKQYFETTTSIGRNNSSSQFAEFMTNEMRLKRESVLLAYEVAKEKNHTMMRLEEMKFLSINTKELSEDDSYWINMKKAKIKEKYNLCRD